ncbi:MAG: hypothetical protein Q4G07_11960 [Oscillospiraceae bacterium]|nr:hypothetical protein [Oscillospiraceae bacterium]
MEEKTVNTSSILQARRRRRNRRIRLGVILCLLLAALLFWLTGMAGSSFAAVSDVLEGIEIALTPGEGFPVKMDATGFVSAAPFAGGVALLGEKDVVLYSAAGNITQSFGRGDAPLRIQPGRNGTEGDQPFEGIGGQNV